MFTTSVDVLYLVLTACILILTIFLVITLYNLIVSLKRINKVTKIIESGVVKVDELVNLAKEKLHNSSAYFMILAEIAKKAIEFVKDKREEKKEVKNKKKK